MGDRRFHIRTLMLAVAVSTFAAAFATWRTSPPRQIGCLYMNDFTYMPNDFVLPAPPRNPDRRPSDYGLAPLPGVPGAALRMGQK
jgi:hypothetical protein